MSSRGFEALALSIQGARRLFGPEADYVVCVNTVPVDDVRRRLGATIPDLYVVQVRRTDIPAWLRNRIDFACAQGAAWKFAPVRVAPACHELSLDNDLILWRTPAAIAGWLSSGDGCVGAECVQADFGKFSAYCGPEPRNSGIRGLPPGFAYEGTLRRLIEEHPVTMDAGADEQGLQAAALNRQDGARMVTAREVSISSPGSPELGTHGAHFAGVNAKAPQPGKEGMERHWDRHREAVAGAVSRIASAKLAA